MTPRVVCRTAAFALCAGLSVAHAEPKPLAGFDAYVRKAMKDWEVPGVAIAIVKDDKVVFFKTYGVRDIAQGAPVDEHTVFAIASCTKAFTSAALAMLVDERKLDWDDPVVQHMSGFKLYDPWVTSEITVRDLLTHRSGLAGPESLWYSFGLQREEILRRLQFEKPVAGFRTRFSYNNPLYMAAGQLLPRVTNLSWDDFIKQRIFEPLGMTQRSTSITALQGTSDVSTPYIKLDDQIRAISYHSVDSAGPAGSINSDLADMVQWLRLQLNGGTFKGRQLISPRSYREMHRPQFIVRFVPGFEERAEPFVQGLNPDAHFNTTGLGWNLWDYHGHLIDEHGGNVDGQSSEVALMPDLHLGFVLLSNMDGSFMRTGLMYRIFDGFLGRPPKDWNAQIRAHTARFFADLEARRKKGDEERIAGTAPSLALDKYVGTFRNDLFGELNVSLEDQRLVLRFGTPVLSSALEHWNYDTFKAHWDDPLVREGKVTFVLDARGNADELRFELTEGARYPFKRVPVGTPDKAGKADGDAHSVRVRRTPEVLIGGRRW
jgi:CubicO group peptidase (beta-lactamase class C family)